jgi:hypothetical protein
VAGDKNKGTIKLSNFIEKSGYTPVVVYDAKELAGTRAVLVTKTDDSNIGHIELVTLDEENIKTAYNGIVLIPQEDIGKFKPGAIASLLEKKKTLEIFKAGHPESSTEVDAAAKIGAKIVEGIMHPEEFNKALALTLSVFGSYDAMLAYLDLNNDQVTSADGVDIIQAAYQRLAYQAVHSGMGDEAINVETDILSVLRDILITVNKDVTNREEIKTILNKDNIIWTEFDRLSNVLLISKSVNRNAIVGGFEKVQNEGGEFVIDFEALKKAIETKKGTIEKIVSFYRGAKGPEDMLPNLDGKYDEKNKQRGVHLSPMMIHAIAAAA